MFKSQPVRPRHTLVIPTPRKEVSLSERRKWLLGFDGDFDFILKFFSSIGTCVINLGRDKNEIEKNR